MEKGNFKVRCINLNGCNHGSYTVGKVYEIENGQLTSDQYVKMPPGRKINSFKEWEAFSSSTFELVNEDTTVIYRKGRETIAILKDGNKTVKTAKAICNPKDEFNVEYGAKLAFARLYGLDEYVTEILLNGIKEVKADGNFKVRCIKTGDGGLTVGKIYEFKDGYSKWNDGARLPQFTHHGISRFSNFSDLVKWFGGEQSTEEFEEVAEEYPVFIPSIGRIIKQDKYEAGDKVKIREDLKYGLYYPHASVTEPMLQYVGKIMTVDSVSKRDDNCTLEGDDRHWTWTPEMFEGKVIEELVPTGTPPTTSKPLDWDSFKAGKFAVHCDTEEKAKSFLWECEQQGITWGGVDKPTNITYFDSYGVFTCYSCIWKNSSLGYGDVECHKGERPIIDYTPNFREVKRPAKAGEWIKIVASDDNSENDYKNGDILKVIEPDKDLIPGLEKDMAFYKNETWKYAGIEEYIVLEPITFTTESESTKKHYWCEHPEIEKMPSKNFGNSARGFIGFGTNTLTSPLALKTHPRWCPMELKNIEKF